MISELKNTIKNILSPHSYGLMVVNSNYFRPISGKHGYISDPYLSDDKYYELCEMIREAR